MSGKNETAGNEFDAWMGAGPSVKARASLDDVVDAGVPEEPGDKGRAGTKGAAVAGLLRKPTVLVPLVIAVAVAGLVVVRGGGGEPNPAEGQYAAIGTAPAETLAEVDAGAHDQDKPPAGEASGPLGPPPEATAEPESVATEVPPAAAVEARPEAEPTPTLEPAPVAEAAPKAESDSQPTRKELELRIAALQNDLERAQQTRAANLRTIRGLRAEVAKREGQGSYSVVAVLNDGVVVRDGSGSERVYGLGARIGE